VAADAVVEVALVDGAKVAVVEVTTYNIRNGWHYHLSTGIAGPLPVKITKSEGSRKSKLRKPLSQMLKRHLAMSSVWSQGSGEEEERMTFDDGSWCTDNSKGPKCWLSCE
jgi:hypothetical protein